jgi:hypothetical protein|tara:strand:- start:464 stop:643 length:180 start_codon:yes stop_codon:yes gene_type:complete
MKKVNEKPKATPVCDYLEYLMVSNDVQVDDCYFDELYGIECGYVPMEQSGFYKENPEDE